MSATGSRLVRPASSGLVRPALFARVRPRFLCLVGSIGRGHEKHRGNKEGPEPVHTVMELSAFSFVNFSSGPMQTDYNSLAMAWAHFLKKKKRVLEEFQNPL
jgi:hypothetical protein